MKRNTTAEVKQTMPRIFRNRLPTSPPRFHSAHTPPQPQTHAPTRAGFITQQCIIQMRYHYAESAELGSEVICVGRWASARCEAKTRTLVMKVLRALLGAVALMAVAVLVFLFSISCELTSLSPALACLPVCLGVLNI